MSTHSDPILPPSQWQVASHSPILPPSPVPVAPPAPVMPPKTHDTSRQEAHAGSAAVSPRKPAHAAKVPEQSNKVPAPNARAAQATSPARSRLAIDEPLIDKKSTRLSKFVSVVQPIANSLAKSISKQVAYWNAPAPLPIPGARENTVVDAVVPYKRANVVNIWNVPFDQVTMDSALDGIASMIAERTPRYVITANLNYAMLAADDPSLGPISDGASMILADGQPIVWRSLLGPAESRLPCRIAGSEMIFHLAQRAAASGWRIYFLGAEPGVAQACADSLAARYPGMIVAGVQSPPYRDLSSVEIAQQFADIRDAKPDILLVAFGQPKGEKWIAQHHQSLGVPVSIQVGASFDFAAGKVERAPLWIQKIGFEWAHRMLGDPKRLVPRYYRNIKYLAVTLTREWIDFANRRFGEHPPAETAPPLLDRRKS